MNNQQRSSPGKMEDFTPSSPPPLRSARGTAYPSIPEERLDNGMRILAVSDDRLPRVGIQLGWPVGRVSDSPRNLSLISLAVESLDKGTQTRSAWEIAKQLDRFAIQFETETMMEFTFVEAAALHQHLERTVGLVAEMVTTPVFPPEELEKLRIRLESSLLAQRSQSTFLARERFYRALFPDHPYHRISLPLEDVRRSDPELVRTAYSSRFGPNNAMLLLAGPVDLSEARTLATRYFGSWRKTVEAPPEPDSPQRLEGRRICLVDRPHSVQSRMLVGGLAPSRRADDFLAFRVANQILGGSGSARLFLNLRERRGYTYGAYSSLSTCRQTGIQIAVADVRSDVTADAVEEVVKEIKRLRESPPTEEELSRAKAELIGAFSRQLETPESIGTLEVMRRLYELQPDYYKGLIARIEAVTADQVLEAARRRFDTEQLVITVVGDRGQLEAGLRRFGEVEVYDSEGRRI